MLYEHILRPILFQMNPEVAHRLAMMGLRVAGHIPSVQTLLRRITTPRGSGTTQLMGLSFPNVLGIAAGFDKDAEVMWSIFGLGFGWLEVGSVSALPWKGNPKPRLRRLVDDQGMINRMGLPSQGVERVLKRIKRSRPPFPLLVNVTKTGDPNITGQAAIDDFRLTVLRIAPVADALVLNLSCPNTEDGRTFENDPAALKELLDQVRMANTPKRPMLVKVSPDTGADGLRTIAEVAMKSGISGFVATNTTKTRHTIRHEDTAGLPPGGLSGVPVRSLSLSAVSTLREFLGPGTPIIGCGGIMDGRDVDDFMDAGANLVQAYTGFIYRGPLFARKVLLSRGNTADADTNG